jgi:hypothetical protein
MVCLARCRTCEFCTIARQREKCERARVVLSKFVWRVIWVSVEGGSYILAAPLC